MVATKVIGRECNGCTKCCEGWLSGTAYGYDFSPGKRCHFLGHKCCSIYPIRPANPCKDFACHWKENKNIPDWLRPDLVNAIILKRFVEKIPYYRIVKSGDKISPKVFDWANENKKDFNFFIFEFDVQTIISEDKTFIEEISKKFEIKV